MPFYKLCTLLLLSALALSGCSPAQVLPASPASTTVFLVRHAEKVDNSDDPALSAAGEHRARALADSLERVDAILVTPYQRTGLTAQPLAARLALTPTVVSLNGGYDSLVTRTAQQVQALPAGSHVLVVGHSNTTTAVIRALGAAPVADIPDCRYGQLFVVTLLSGTAARVEERAFGTADTCG